LRTCTVCESEKKTLAQPIPGTVKEYNSHVCALYGPTGIYRPWLIDNAVEINAMRSENMPQLRQIKSSFLDFYGTLADIYPFKTHSVRPNSGKQEPVVA
jgi:hypothetical protein